MIIQLIWIAAVYAAAIALVHILHSREQARREPGMGKRWHYILITRNHEAVVEWYIRMFSVHALLTGKRLSVTLMDDGSEDGTLEVAGRLVQAGASFDFAPLSYSQLPHDNQAFRPETVLDLRAMGESAVLPLMRMPGSGGFGSRHGQ